MKQNQRDADMHIKNLRHQLEQVNSAVEFRSHEFSNNQSENIQNL